MITIDTQNIFRVSKEHGLKKSDIERLQKKIPHYLAKIHSHNQGFYTVIDDTEMVREILEYATAQKKVFDHIVVLGIGGSALGTICLQQSLGHLFSNELKGKKKTSATLHVLDNIDPILIQEVQDVINIKKTLFIVVSKSGTTPEVLSQFLYFKNQIKKQNLSLQKHLVFITDPEEGFLVDVAKQEGIKTFSIPPNVGGRFSVLTPVGLLPAALIGIDIKKLLKGAQQMRDSFLTEHPKENLPFTMAAIQYLLSRKGKSIHVMMPYAQKLIRFSDWYRQLLAESIGKQLDNNGNTVHVGITPVNALGATDQHSQSQLYNEGPNDKLFLFIAVNRLAKKIPIPSLYPKDARTAYMKGVSFNSLIQVEQEATAESYTQNNRPNLTVQIDSIDEFHLGQLFLLFEGATAFLGELYNINAFDQPGVELAKILTKERLQ